MYIKVLLTYVLTYFRLLNDNYGNVLTHLFVLYCVLKLCTVISTLR